MHVYTLVWLKLNPNGQIKQTHQYDVVKESNPSKCKLHPSLVTPSSRSGDTEEAGITSPPWQRSNNNNTCNTIKQYSTYKMFSYDGHFDLPVAESCYANKLAVPISGLFGDAKLHFFKDWEKKKKKKISLRGCGGYFFWRLNWSGKKGGNCIIKPPRLLIGRNFVCPCTCMFA